MKTFVKNFLVIFGVTSYIMLVCVNLLHNQIRWENMGLAFATPPLLGVLGSVIIGIFTSLVVDEQRKKP